MSTIVSENKISSIFLAAALGATPLLAKSGVQASKPDIAKVETKEKKLDQNAINTIALTIFAEAAGESRDGKIAVASVIWNRAVRWYGSISKLSEVCKARKQFSCWNAKPLLVSNIPKDKASRDAWKYCLAIAQDMVAGTFTPTTTADHYHADYVSPSWGKQMKKIATIGKHIFYDSKRKM